MRSALRRWRLLVAIALLAGIVLPGSSPAATCDAVSRSGDGWERSTPPELREDLLQVAASPLDPDRIWVTDGYVVVVTTDGGCHWAPVFFSSFLNLGGGDQTAGIRQLEVSGSPGAERVLVVETRAALAGGVRSITVHVARGADDAFTEMTGLPLFGEVRLAVGSFGAAYALVLAPLGGSVLSVQDEPGEVYVAAGTAFTRRGALPSGFAAAAGRVDAAGRVYVWSAERLLRSEDGGSSVQDVVLGGAAVSSVSAGPPLVVLSGGPVALVSTDGGRSGRDVAMPPGARSVVPVVGTPLVGVITGEGVGLVDLRSGVTFDASPERLPMRMLDATAGDPALVGISGNTVAVLPLRAGRPALPVTKRPTVSLVPPVPGLLPDSSLAPAKATLSLQPGQTRRVDYRLELPPVPGPLDVYFLVDTTGSMQPAIDGLRRSIQDIVNDLARTNLDVQMGLGEFRDVDEADLLGGAVYRRAQRIAPPGEGLRRALEQMGIGGGGDEPEADTIALVQAVHGKGQTGVVQAGQEAGFRAAATKVVVLVTDAPFHLEPPVYPTMAETIQVLGGLGVRVLGLAVGERPLRDLRAIAQGTSALAPEGGIDCDNDGDVELQQGEPAVCVLPDNGRGAARLGEPIIALLRGVQQPGVISVRATGNAVGRVVGDVEVTMDLARPTPLVFAVDYTCRSADAGRVLTAELRAAAGARDLAAASARVTCGTVAVAPPPEVPVEPEVPPAVQVVVAAPAPPPAQVPQAAPAVNPQAAPQPGTVANAQLIALTVEQQQEQLELALAQQEAESFGEELAMVARPRREEQEAARLLLATSLAMASAVGVLHWRRALPGWAGVTGTARR